MPEVTVMADYGAFPLWKGTGAFMIDRDTLQLRDELRIALAEWSRFYDETLSSNEYQWPSEEVERSFVERGRVLAHQGASSLGTGYRVLSFNDETGERESI